MIIKIRKTELMSLLGPIPVSLKEFVGLSWAQDGMILSSSRTLFLGSLNVSIIWPKKLEEFQTNRENINAAIAAMFAQVDERYLKAVQVITAKEAQKQANTTPAPATT